MLWYVYGKDRVGLGSLGICIVIGMVMFWLGYCRSMVMF